MITLLDGPAAGEVFETLRHPKLIRITQNGITFRALDGFGDEPEETELIYIYQRGTDSTYRFTDPQPKDHQVRLTQCWRGWAERQQSTPQLS